MFSNSCIQVCARRLMAALAIMAMAGGAIALNASGTQSSQDSQTGQSSQDPQSSQDSKDPQTGQEPIRVTFGGLEYEIGDGVATLTGMSAGGEAPAQIVIPEAVPSGDAQCPVTFVKPGAFAALGGAQLIVFVTTPPKYPDDSDKGEPLFADDYASAGKVFVPSASAVTYASDPVWGVLADIQPISYGLSASELSLIAGASSKLTATAEPADIFGKTVL